MIKEIAIDYFKTFSNKNISKLKLFFSDDVVLRDWDVSEKGIERVLQANSNIFNSVESIDVKPINLLECNETIVAELEIKINSKEIILVTDIIEFNKSGKIKSIRAYKGN